MRHSTAVEADEFRFFGQLFDFVKLGTACQDAEMSEMIANTLFLLFRHDSLLNRVNQSALFLGKYTNNAVKV